MMNGINNVTAGQTFALIIDNWSADANGYTLTFTGTALITDVTPPTINPPNSVINNCNGTFTIAFSEPVLCSSIAANGSDFTLTGGGTITSATGVGCTGGTTLTSQVTITYTVPSSGTYTLGVQVGTDGNTILDKCSNAMLTNQTVILNVLNALTITPSVTTLCAPGTVNLTVGGAPNNLVGIYTLNPGGLVGNSDGTGHHTFAGVPVNTTTTFVVTATYGGCTGSASVTIKVENMVASITPMNTTICPTPGTTTLTASGSGGTGPYTYSWSGGYNGTSNPTPAVGAGTYTVTVTSANGCTATQTSTITIASPGGSTNCNIYYVSPAGGGTGLIKSSPTTLQNALALSTCQNAIIKMQVGIYTLTDKVDVSSYVTIEGGFNAVGSPFTIKTSDMSGGANSTTIRRSSGADTGDPGKCSAFKVVASSTAFRFQDLRIELPGSSNVAAHAAGSGLSNYGIRMETGCTSYNIVRCYIDAGKGSQ